MLLAILVFSACAPTRSEQTAASIPASTLLHTQSPNLTPTFTHTHTLANTKQPTSSPEPTQTPIPTPTQINVSDPRIKELENNGYKRQDLARFEVSASGETTLFGGPDSEHTFPQLVDGPYAYFQYFDEETRNCKLVFADTKDDKYSLISIIDVSELNERIKREVTPTSYSYGPNLQCSPLGWGDINRNGMPDMSVALMWANHYTGSEVHIFEILGESTVVDLVKDLPGIISPWAFDPSQTRQAVFDLSWANHDCIYPPMAVTWVYDWRDGKYEDITTEVDFTQYIDSLRETISHGFGEPFDASVNIEPLTTLLLIYDRTGRRDQGWREYLELTDQSHWPDTPPDTAKWLKSDVEHFTREYKLALPFTPNDFCVGQ